MSTVIRPVGPQRAQVYWRRRVLAVVLLVAVVLALGFGLRSLLTSGDPDPQVDPAAGASQPADPSAAAADPTAPSDEAGSAQSPAADAAAAEGEVPGCAEGQVLVAATTDATAYPAGATATVGMTITNTGTAPCLLDAGSAALELLVVSGSDRIWSSDDCQTSAESRPTTVAPGEAGMLASGVEWPLVRSAEGCPEGLAAPRAGTYQLTARAGDVTSAPLAFDVQ